MHHDVPLISTIAMSLLFAFGGGWIASKLKLPPLVGYLLAGIAVGPFTPGYVADSGIAQQLAEVGVILLMFGVGLHFSVRDLWAVRTIALPGAVAQIGVATAIGAVMAALWGWSLASGLVFGLALSVASTVVLLRSLEERDAVQTLNGRIAVGWLIVEDLAMVVALVLLPVLATAAAPSATGATPGVGEILAMIGTTLAKVALFIAVVLFGGRRVVPWILDQVARLGSREMFTLSVLALALGIAYLSSTLFGVSFALGAFFAGVVMSESDLSQQAAADSLPLKEAFAVLFFVSVGMLFDPAILLREPLAVISVLLVIIVGKSLAAFGIVLLFRYPVSTALMVSASLAQIGEFSFILVAQGLALGLLPPEGQDYVLAGALLSIALNPAVVSAMIRVERWLLARPGMLSRLERQGQDRLSGLPEGDEGPAVADHAVIVGFGRVGRMVARALDERGIPYVVVEHNRPLVERLRAEGLAAISGDASVPGVLEKAHIERARLLVAAVPDGFQVRQIVAIGRAACPGLDIVARTHCESEQSHLERLGVGKAVMGEHQLALAMTDYALAAFAPPVQAAPAA